jgi:hypothetical protein
MRFTATTKPTIQERDEGHANLQANSQYKGIHHVNNYPFVIILML